MEKVLGLINKVTGLNFNSAHKEAVFLYISSRLEILNLTATEYLDYLRRNPRELSLLIDEAAINETYFFREQSQFEFLEKAFLPKHSNKNLVVWSAACSSGEEPVSIYALCNKYNIRAEIFASDIDMSAIEVFKKGVYRKNSFRKDGSLYRNLLVPLGNLSENQFVLSEKSRDAFTILPYNLNGFSELPFEENSLNIIFLRNVFIYFDEMLRNRILSRICGLLKEGGILLLSTNEIPMVKPPANSGLVKSNWGSTFYFEKKSSSIFEEMNANKETQVQNPKNESAPRTSVSSNTKRTSSQLEEKLNPVVELICASNFEAALELLEKFSFRPENEEYHYYLLSKIENSRNEKQKAEDHIERALCYNSSFWPALFEKALILKYKNKTREMIMTLYDCTEKLLRYINEQRTDYDFLVERFSPSYFLNLCYQYIFD